MFVFKLEHTVEISGYIVQQSSDELWLRWTTLLIVVGAGVGVIGALRIGKPVGLLMFFTGIVLVIAGAVADATVVWPAARNEQRATVIEQIVDAEVTDVSVDGNTFTATIDGEIVCGTLGELDDDLFLYPTGSCPA